MMRSANSLAIVAGIAGVVFGQAVTFNTPSPWMTLRSQELDVKALLDTAKIESEKVQLKAVKIVNGRAMTINSSSFSATNYSEEYSLGSMGSDIIGGNDYLKIEWSIPGGDEKGTVEPFGLVVLDSATELDIDLRAAKGKSGSDAAVSNDEMKQVGGHKIGMAYDDKALSIVVAKGGDAALTVAFDGKNGKYAFVSYPDRFVTLYPGNDSIYAYNHSRGVTDSGISYKEKQWVNDIEVLSRDGKTVITIPWYDLGVLPFDGRIVGFVAYEQDSDGAIGAMYPLKAQKPIPGTWGNVMLGEKKETASAK